MARTHQKTHTVHPPEDTDIYYWTDRDERHYVQLRVRHHHWNVEWGFRDPPGGPRRVEQDEQTTSMPEEAVRVFLEAVRTFTSEPETIGEVELRLRAAIARNARDEAARR